MTDFARSFQAAVRAAQIQLMLGDPAEAVRCLRIAMKSANRLTAAHRSVTMRALNWTRVALARGAAGALST